MPPFWKPPAAGTVPPNLSLLRSILGIDPAEVINAIKLVAEGIQNADRRLAAIEAQLADIHKLIDPGLSTTIGTHAGNGGRNGIASEDDGTILPHSSTGIGTS